MWIAKPLNALSDDEKKSWIRICRDRELSESGLVPLSQTLTWAAGISAVGGHAFLVFSPQERVGGLVFAISGNDGFTYECVNGPILDWDHSSLIARQFATFALAVSKLPRFRSLTVKPRWIKAKSGGRLALLPIEPSQLHGAATIRISIQDSLENQEALLKPRLRRSLSKARKSPIESSWKRITDEDLDRFVPLMREFGAKKGFTVPPSEWFRALLRDPGLLEAEGISFWLASARLKSVEGKVAGDLESEILVCVKGAEGHYLFGREKRGLGISSHLSSAAVAHWEALSQLRSMGLKIYDLNGYVLNSTEDLPARAYAGVCRFKEQWGGEVVEYLTPEFGIT